MGKANGHTAKLTFLGAAGTVTGSRTLVEHAGEVVLIDCGLFQGPKPLREKNWAPFPVSPQNVNAIVLTHAHLDHSGYLPRFVAAGYRGPIYCSEGTHDLVKILLMDSAHLEEEEARYANITHHSRHRPALPLFTTRDAENCLGLLVPEPRDKWIEIGRDIRLRYLRAGHIIGASFVQLGMGTQIVTFSGDIGHGRSYTMRPPVDVDHTDTLVLESTYGNRLHPREDVKKDLGLHINRVLDRQGVVVFPTFSVGRAQELIYIIRLLEDEGLIPSVPVVLDSPMAAQATEIFIGHPEDHKIIGLTSANERAVFFPHDFQFSHTPEESMYTCMRGGPMIVLSAAGMLTGGRILHHLKVRLRDSKNAVLMTGYQAEGTRGRYLLDNFGQAETLRIHHQDIAIDCEVKLIEGLSAHGDYEDIVEWFGRMKSRPRKIFLNHGTADSMRALAATLAAKFGITPVPILEETTVEV